VPLVLVAQAMVWGWPTALALDGARDTVLVGAWGRAGA